MRETGAGGFVLVATLWFVALLALVAVLVEGWLSTALERGASLASRVQAHSSLLSAEQRVAFTLATATASPRGMELAPPTGARSPEPDLGPAEDTIPDRGPFVALDDRAYRIGDITVRAQDGAGLYDINGADRGTLDRILKGFGVPETVREALARALIDYRTKPANSAEGREAEYARDGLPAPRHAPLLTPWELLRVPGWATQSQLWRSPDALVELTTLGPIGGANVNTASARVISAVLDVDGVSADRFIRARIGRPLTNLGDTNLAARPTGDEARSPLFVPSNTIRLTFTGPTMPWLHALEIRLTPSGKTPLRVDFAVSLPKGARTDAIAGAPAWPTNSVAQSP